MGGGITRVVVGVLATAVLAAVGVPAASGEGLSPWWHLGSGARPTYLPPEGKGVIVGTVVNVGDASTSIENASHESTPVRIVDRLPPGLRAVEVEGVVAAGTSHELLKCEHSAVEAVCAVEGETSAVVLPVAPFNLIEVRVGVVVEPGARTCEPDASACESNEVSVSGGGAPSASVSRPVTISEEPPPFGIEDYELLPEEVGGRLDTRAASHPFQATFAVGLNQTAQTASGDGSVAVIPIALTRDLDLRFPAGLIADPRSVARCSDAQFEAEPNECPAGSVVGVAVVTANEPETVGVVTFTEPVFNLEPSQGEPARFGFLPHNRETPIYVDTAVRTGGDYGITGEVRQVTQAVGVLSMLLTFWGVPGDERHDETRDGCLPVHTGYYPCEPLVESNPPPFFQLPASCTGQLRSSVEVDSWENPGNFATGENIVSAPAKSLPALDGCGGLSFRPSVEVQPDVRQASKPSGLSVDVHVPEEASKSVAALGSSDIRDMTIALPAGVALNPAGADGLQACSESQVGFTGLQALDPEFEPGALTATFTPALPEPLEQGVNFCPAAAKIGTVRIATPLLAGPLTGAVYLASPQSFPAGPGENPFASLVAVYVVAREPESGVLVKLPGSVSLDEATGQITVTLHNTPQLPFEDIELRFFGGELAPLSTPARCGSYTTRASFVPWSTLPGGTPSSEPVRATSSFEITSGPNGGADGGGSGGSSCPGASLPFEPSLSAGTASIQAGGFSPLTVTVGREDGQQALQGLRLALPPGLEGVLSGVPLCPEAQANAGTCGAASEIGETTLSAGLGGDPLTITGGRVYLTEPYEGAPFGLSIEVPARVGPFTLRGGRPIVIRAKLEINPASAALTITTAAIPTIIEGFPLQIQHLNITIGRPGFIFNPTNCARQSITGTIGGNEGAQIPVSVPFQATNCAMLKFGPKLTASTEAHGEALKGGTGASLNVAIASRGDAGAGGEEANIKRVDLTLPKLLPARLQPTLQNACTKARFAKDPADCPPDSFVGTATAVTPLLDVPLKGPAIFVSRGGTALPDLDLVLKGEGVRILLTGHTEVKGEVTYSKFEMFPDVPISSFALSLPEGPHSALASGLPTNDRSLCGQSLEMPTTIEGQNGAVRNQTTKVRVAGCKPALYIRSTKVSGKSVTVTVTVPAAGKIAASGEGLRGQTKHSTGEKLVTLKLALIGAQASKVSPGHRLKVRVDLAFTPRRGRRLTKSLAVSFS
jgi:hypothetical protein